MVPERKQWATSGCFQYQMQLTRHIPSMQIFFFVIVIFSLLSWTQVFLQCAQLLICLLHIILMERILIVFKFLNSL